MKVISLKGFGRGDRGLTEVLYRQLSGENGENFTNINEILNETDKNGRTGISKVQILAEMYIFCLQTGPLSPPSLPPSLLRNLYRSLYLWSRWGVRLTAIAQVRNEWISNLGPSIRLHAM
jgi:hypothetical protein